MDCTTAGRWVYAGDLRVGDELLARDGRTRQVEAIQHTPFKDKVYNFHVAELETYAVGKESVLVHNVNDDVPGTDGAALDPGNTNPYDPEPSQSAAELQKELEFLTQELPGITDPNQLIIVLGQIANLATKLSILTN